MRKDANFMTRTELIKVLADSHKEVSSNKVDEITKHIFTLMAKSLVVGVRIEIRGFGTFAIRKRELNAVRNPRTGDKIYNRCSKKSIHFKPGKELKLRVNNLINRDKG